MKRKTIALCESGYHPESEAKIINIIINKCKENNVNLLIFNPLMKTEDYPRNLDLNSNVVRGENEIFNLINYQMIDGLIMFSASFRQRETVLEIAKRCKRYNIPILNVNNPAVTLEHNISIVNSDAMELMVEHLVKVHKLSRINFIGGYPENDATKERLAAYKKVLTKYNIPVEEDRIAYGYFWNQSVECTKQFLKKDVPQAIVCANDTMAMFVSDYLKNEGYKIPKDIIVTGFDGISSAFEYEPSITTIQPKYEYAGEQTFEMMVKLMNGEENVEDVQIDSALILQESCGCKSKRKKNSSFIVQQGEQKDAYNNFTKLMVRANIYFSDEQNLDDLFDHISEPLEYFKFKSLVYCIDEELSPKNQYYFDSKIDKFELPKKLVGFVPFYKKFSQGDVFNTKQMLFFDVLNNDKPCVRFFSPLYFKNRNLGFISYETDNYLSCDFDTFKLWAFNSSEKIGSFCIKREQELLSVKDYLTGLYNRRGMEKYFEEVYSKVIPNGEYISLVCVDIDYLKIINDKFGHEHGDNAIIQTSSAIKNAFSKNSICVRTGGDEFCILTHSSKKQNLDKTIEKLDKYLADYNAKSNLSYDIQCSCGHFTLFSKDFSSFEEMQRIADAELYKVKAKHHHRRITDEASKKLKK